MALTDDLDRILEWHARHKTPLAQQIRPGLSEDEILTKISRLPFRLPREFVDLYRWRDGTPPGPTGGDMLFFEFHRFLPLDVALSTFEASYPIMKGFYELADWVMTFADAAGDGYGVSGGRQQAETAPVVFLFEGEGVRVAFDSLGQMLKTVVQAFDEGVFWWADGRLEADYDRWGEVGYRLNPGMQYWRDYVGGGE